MPIVSVRGLGRTLGRLLVPAFVTLALACEGSPLPEEPEAPSPAEPTNGHAADAVTADRTWADGYVWANDPTSASYTPLASRAYNWTGGPIRITRPAGTTGRYVVTFTGLSAALGAKSTVKATGYGGGNSYCKPVTGYLVSDKVEVRCYKGATGTPVNSRFTLVVSRAEADRAFAYAHQPTSAEYSPDPRGSWNPTGSIKVKRTGVGRYEVVFTNLRSQMSTNFGHAQVNAVGSGKAHCAVNDWGGLSDWSVYVDCLTPAGAPVDSKFAVLFLLPNEHLAYALGDQPSAASYSPQASYSWNPAGGGVTITRSAVGKYTIWWVGVDAKILGAGNVQVGDAGNAQCKVTNQGAETAQVQCFAPNGTLVDGGYTVLLGS
jgi:hypothetical protein